MPRFWRRRGGSAASRETDCADRHVQGHRLEREADCGNKKRASTTSITGRLRDAPDHRSPDRPSVAYPAKRHLPARRRLPSRFTVASGSFVRRFRCGLAGNTSTAHRGLQSVHGQSMPAELFRQLLLIELDCRHAEGSLRQGKSTNSVFRSFRNRYRMPLGRGISETRRAVFPILRSVHRFLPYRPTLRDRTAVGCCILRLAERR